MTISRCYRRAYKLVDPLIKIKLMIMMIYTCSKEEMMKEGQGEACSTMAAFK